MKLLSKKDIENGECTHQYVFDLHNHIEAQKKRLSALTYIANTSKDENEELKEKLEVSDQENFDLRKGLEPTFSDLVGELDNLKAKLQAIESNKVAEFRTVPYDENKTINDARYLLFAEHGNTRITYGAYKPVLENGETYTVTISKETK